MSHSSNPRVRHVSSYHLELRRLGEVSARDGAWMEEHLRTCTSCAELAAADDQYRREFLGTVGARPHRAIAARVETPRRWLRRRWTIGMLLPAAVAAASLAIFVSRHRAGTPSVAPMEPELTVKGGGCRLQVAARRGSRVFLVRPGQLLQAGDQIRFLLEHVSLPYVLIVSVDGAGQANVYVPYGGSASTAIDRSAGADRIEIPGSIIIDGTPGPERMFALLSRGPLQTAPVRAALLAVGKRGAASIRGVTALDVGADEQVSILIEKMTP